MAPYSSSSFIGHIQGDQYASGSITIDRKTSTSFRLIVRTRQAWVDRQRVYIAVQVFDEYGFPNAHGNPLNIQLISSSVISQPCQLSSSHPFIGHCNLQTLPSFTFSGQFVDIEAQLGSFPPVVYQNALELVQMPIWYTDALRAPASTSLPVGTTLNPGVLLTLPTSPVRALETFTIEVYASTNGNNLAATHLWLHFDEHKIEYLTYRQTSGLNTFSVFTSTPGIVQMIAADQPDGTDPSLMTGDAVYVISIDVRFKAGTAPGLHDNLFTSTVYTMTNLGNVVFCQTQIPTYTCPSLFHDLNDVASPHGDMVVIESEPVGLFAFLEQPAAINHAHLTGVVNNYSSLVYQVESDDASTHSHALVTPQNCHRQEEFDAYFELYSYCSIYMDSTHTENGLVSVDVTHNNLNVTFNFFAFSPNVTLEITDAILNRIVDVNDQTIEGCAATVYQHTGIRALVNVDGHLVDVSPMLQFQSSNQSVATVGSGIHGNYVYGASAGSTVISLQGVPTVQVQLSVSDSPVNVVDMTTRLVTSGQWLSSPASNSPYSFSSSYTKSMLYKQELHNELDYGYVYASVTYSDGHDNDVSYMHSYGSNEVMIDTSNADIGFIPPLTAGNIKNFWKLQVNPDAVLSCSLIQANWTMCNQTVAVSEIPVFLNLPVPYAIVVTAAHVDMTEPGDASSYHPVGKVTSTSISVVVYYQHPTTQAVTSKIMSGDSRITYTVSDPSCGSANGALSVLSSAVGAKSAGCTNVTVSCEATLGGVTLSSSTSVPLVFADNLQLEYKPYPLTSANQAISVTDLKLLPCVGVYQQTTAKLHLTLTDATTHDVTSHSLVTSSNAQLLVGDATSYGACATCKITANASGTYILGGQFPVAQPGTVYAMSMLTAGAQTLSFDSVSWQLHSMVSTAHPSAYSPFKTFNAYQNGTASSQVTVVLGGISYPDIIGASYNFDHTDLISFSAASSGIVDVDQSGILTLYDNFYNPVQVSAQSCTSNVSQTHNLYANLKASENDVDLGYLTGTQYYQSTEGSQEVLKIEVRVRGEAGKDMTAFGVRINFPVGSLSTSAAQGAYFSASGTYNNIETEFEQSGYVLVNGADSNYVGDGGDTGLHIGTVTLPITASGVHLVYASVEVIQNTNRLDRSDYYEYDSLSTVAGTGYASLTTTTRRRRLESMLPHEKVRMLAEGPITPPRFMVEKQPRRKLSTDPCTCQVWGDVNGNCAFNAGDVAQLQRIVTLYASYANDMTGLVTNPLEDFSTYGPDHTASTYNTCGQTKDSFMRVQVNPSHNVLSLPTTDARFLQPEIESNDPVLLLRASVKKQRLVTSVDAHCTFSTSGEARQDVRVVVRVVGGQGQRLSTVGADDQLTQVIIEARTHPSPSNETYHVNVGEQIMYGSSTRGFTSYATPNSSSFTESAFNSMPSGQHAAVFKMQRINAQGDFELRFQPIHDDNTTDFTYQFAMTVETRATTNVEPYVPQSFQPYIGSELRPYLDSGSSFNPIWGVVTLQLEGRVSNPEDPPSRAKLDTRHHHLPSSSSFTPGTSTHSTAGTPASRPTAFCSPAKPPPSPPPPHPPPRRRRLCLHLHFLHRQLCRLQQLLHLLVTRLHQPHRCHPLLLPPPPSPPPPSPPPPSPPPPLSPPPLRHHLLHLLLRHHHLRLLHHLPRLLHHPVLRLRLHLLHRHHCHPYHRHHPPPSPPPPPSLPPPPPIECTLDFVSSLTYGAGQSIEHDALQSSLSFVPDGYIHVEFVLMQRYMQAAIDNDYYIDYQCTVVNNILSRLTCLDIGSLNTLNNLINTSTAAADNLTEFNSLPAGNLLGTQGSYLLYGSNCYPHITGDGRINAYDISVLMWSYFGDSPYNTAGLSSSTVTARVDEQQLCDYSVANNVTRTEYILALAANPCDPFNLTSYQIPQLGSWDFADGLLGLNGTVASLSGLAVPAGKMRSSIVTWSDQSSNGRWNRIQFDENTALSIELTLVGVLHAPKQGILSNEPAPLFNCTNCDPKYTPEKLTVLFERVSRHEPGRSCAKVIGTSQFPIYDGTINIRQQPPVDACRLQLYVWTPANKPMRSRGRSSVNDDACDGNLGIWPGSSAMMANVEGGVIQTDISCLGNINKPYVPNTATEQYSTVAIVVFIIALVLSLCLCINILKMYVVISIEDDDKDDKEGTHDTSTDLRI